MVPFIRKHVRSRFDGFMSTIKLNIPLHHVFVFAPCLFRPKLFPWPWKGRMCWSKHVQGLGRLQRKHCNRHVPCYIGHLQVCCALVWASPCFQSISMVVRRLHLDLVFSLEAREGLTLEFEVVLTDLHAWS